jgi:hypothetical protein
VRAIGDQRGGRKAYVRYSRKLAARILARLALGESLTAICRDPDMPHQSSVRNWCRKYPAFRDRYEQARARLEAVRAQVCERLARGEPLRTICADRDLPGRRTIQRWVKADPGFRRQYENARDGWERCRRWRRPYSSELAEEIFSRIGLNENLLSICRDPHMPNYFTVLGWLRRYPDFRREYRRTRQFQWYILRDMRIEVGREMTLRGYPRRKKLIPKLAPYNRGLPPMLKDML